MKSRGSPQARRQMAGARVCIFGEDDNDRRSVKVLAEGLRPGLRGRTVLMRKPTLLVRDASVEKLEGRRKGLLAELARAASTGRKVEAVLVHEDCDAVEPAHVSHAARMRDTFEGVDCDVCPVTPAWELEAWLMLWPSVLGRYRSSWRAPMELAGTQVGKIVNAKEHLRAKLRPKALNKREAARFRSYEEADAPEILTLVAKEGLLEKPEARSGSYDAFRSALAAVVATAP